MPGHLDAGKVSFKCPKCGKNIETSLGRLKSQPNFSCTCGQRINAQQAAKSIRELDKRIEDIGKGFGKC